MRSLAPGLAKWSPAAVPLARCSAIIRSKAAVARSTGLGVESACQHDDPGPVGERARQLGLHARAAAASSAAVCRRAAQS